MNDKKVSVIIPVYNCKDFIEKCLCSVMAQEYKNIEIIVIDDGSTDGSGEIIDVLASKDDRIKVLHKANEGVSSARNDAIRVATGDYLLFVDGDDYIDRDYIRNLVEAASKNDSELIVCGFITEDVHGRVLSRVIPTEYSANDEAWVYRISAVCSRLYSRALWNRLEVEYTLEKNVRGEDVPISILANYCARNITIVDSAGYHYVQHSNSAMHNFKGMQTFLFPRQAMIDMAQKASQQTNHNGREFYVFGIIKMFAQFDLVISRGMEKKEKKKLEDFFKSFLRDYCDDYASCWKYVKCRSRNIPFSIRVAINLFVVKMRFSGLVDGA